MTAIPDSALVIGLGGNVGDDAAILERFARARTALAQLGGVRSASLYRTAPLGPRQAAFLNSAVRVEVSDATPGQIIETVLEIERLLGRDRDREARWGPRTIDLDILVWGMRELRWEGPPPLEVPHPHLGERRFALQPLIDLFGDTVTIPGRTGIRSATAGELGPATAGALIALVKEQSVALVAEVW